MSSYDAGPLPSPPIPSYPQTSQYAEATYPAIDRSPPSSLASRDRQPSIMSLREREFGWSDSAAGVRQPQSTRQTQDAEREREKGDEGGLTGLVRRVSRRASRKDRGTSRSAREGDGKGNESVENLNDDVVLKEKEGIVGIVRRLSRTRSRNRNRSRTRNGSSPTENLLDNDDEKGPDLQPASMSPSMSIVPELPSQPSSRFITQQDYDDDDATSYGDVSSPRFPPPDAPVLRDSDKNRGIRRITLVDGPVVPPETVKDSGVSHKDSAAMDESKDVVGRMNGGGGDEKLSTSDRARSQSAAANGRSRPPLKSSISEPENVTTLSGLVRKMSRKLGRRNTTAGPGTTTPNPSRRQKVEAAAAVRGSLQGIVNEDVGFDEGDEVGKAKLMSDVPLFAPPPIPGLQNSPALSSYAPRAPLRPRAHTSPPTTSPQQQQQQQQNHLPANSSPLASGSVGPTSGSLTGQQAQGQSLQRRHHHPTTGYTSAGRAIVDRQARYASSVWGMDGASAGDDWAI